jgi:2-polyprenyl-3-methyl-5-hydroxy-6-metoxy-1,4-benzoquinol methylase
MDKSKAAADIFNKHADLYQEKFMDVSLYHDSFDFFCKSITKQNASVLELACGPGNITKYLLDKRPDLKILGTDLAPNMIGLAKQNNPSAKFKLMDCRSVDSLTEKYDAVMCGFCLPYLSKEEAIKLIGGVSKLLNPGGIFYISTMEDDYTKSGFKKGSKGDEIFIHYHEGGYLTKSLEENNFKTLNWRRQEFPETDGSVTIDLIIISQKN